MYKRYLVVWYNPHKQSYYYRLLKSNLSEYRLGFVNQYDHIVVLIDKIEFFYSKRLSVPVKTRIKKSMISFLEKNL